MCIYASELKKKKEEKRSRFPFGVKITNRKIKRNCGKYRDIPGIGFINSDARQNTVERIKELSILVSLRACRNRGGCIDRHCELSSSRLFACKRFHRLFPRLSGRNSVGGDGKDVFSQSVSWHADREWWSFPLKKTIIFVSFRGWTRNSNALVSPLDRSTKFIRRSYNGSWSVVRGDRGENTRVGDLWQSLEIERLMEQRNWRFIGDGVYFFYFRDKVFFFFLLLLFRSDVE